MNDANSNDDDDQRALLQKAGRGDGNAFAALYQQHARAVYGLALRMTGEPASAEDVLQDTFLRALQRSDGFRGEASLRHWLKRIACNAAIDRLRRDRRLSSLDAVDELETPETPPDGAARDALGMLARLPPAARTVVWLHEMEGHTHPEIAAMFGRSQSWSKSLLARSLEKLRHLLESSS